MKNICIVTRLGMFKDKIYIVVIFSYSQKKEVCFYG